MAAFLNAQLNVKNQTNLHSVASHSAPIELRDVPLGSDDEHDTGTIRSSSAGSTKKRRARRRNRGDASTGGNDSDSNRGDRGPPKLNFSGIGAAKAAMDLHNMSPRGTHLNIGPGTVREKFYAVLNGPGDMLFSEGGHKALLKLSWFYQLLIVTAILASVVSFLAGSSPSLWGKDDPGLATLEWICVILFTVDYILRFILTPESRFLPPLMCRSKCCSACFNLEAPTVGFFWQVMNQIDLWSVLPFYLEVFVSLGSSVGMDAGMMAAMMMDSNAGGAFTALRVLRLFRLLRVFKVAKYSKLLTIVGETLSRSVAGFALLIFSVAMASLLFGALEFYVENLSSARFICLNPDSTAEIPCTGTAVGAWYYTESTMTSAGYPVPPGDWAASPFQSVLDASWWALVTLTTVGYGDKFPISAGGQLVAAMTVLCGLVVLAFPITIIGNNFNQLANEAESKASDEHVWELAAKASQSVHGSAKLLSVLRTELQAQAAAINDLQSAVDQAAARWRVMDTAASIVSDRLANRADELSLRFSSGGEIN